MGRIPKHLKEIISRNIRACRVNKFPGRGGAKKCAEAFGVSPQQWSPWERGFRTPDEFHLEKLALFFDVTVEYLRTDHANPASARYPHLPQSPFPGAREQTPDSLHPPFHSPPVPVDTLSVEPSGAIHDLLESANRLVWYATLLQNDALTGRRPYAPTTEILRQARLLLEGRMRG